MKAMMLKEFRQLRRDRRTVALMIGMPLLLLVVFGYAARFDVNHIRTVVVGPQAESMADRLPAVYDVRRVAPAMTDADARDLLRNSKADAVLVAGSTVSKLYLDGTQLFVAQSALRRLPALTVPTVLFNPALYTPTVMVPSLIGMILLFIGTIVTSLGVVREREQGTLEQLAVMPLRPIDVAVGKIAPYFVISVVDMVVVTVIGHALFDVPFRGSVLVYAVFALVFLVVVLGLGVAISTLSQSQGQAVQLAMLVLLPQVMLSGLLFPLESMRPGVRWLGWCLPLTWFIRAMRGIFLKGSDVSALAVPFLVLVGMAAVVLVVAVVRFRRDLAPTQRTTQAAERVAP